MPPSVLEGRIVKNIRPTLSPPIPRTQLAKYNPSVKSSSNRADRIDLSDYHEEIKYYYLHRKYTQEQVHEAMEALFNIGATPKQYSGYISKCNFGKKLSDKEWQDIAPVYYASLAEGNEISIRVNDEYIIDSSSVKKQLPRHISPLLQQYLIKHPQESTAAISSCNDSYAVGRLQAFIPSIHPVRQEIPKRILSKLPICLSEELLLRICNDQLKLQFGGSKELARVTGSYYFKHLRNLLYRLSNNISSPLETDDLLDKVMRFGYRSSLKSLLSVNILPVKMAAEHMIPLLVLRQDEDLINHIMDIHSPLRVHIKWYEGFEEIVFRRCKGYFFYDETEMTELLKKYGSLELIRFIANGIENDRMASSTACEGAILVACATRYCVMDIHTMQRLLPLGIQLEEIEAAYIELYGESVLEFDSPIGLKELLEMGFRGNIGLVTLEAVLRHDNGKASDLLPFAISIEELEFRIPENRLMKKVPRLLENLDHDDFNMLIHISRAETRSLSGRSGHHIWCLICVAYRLQDVRLRDYLVSYFKAYHRHICQAIFNEALCAIIALYTEESNDPECWLSRFYDCTLKKDEPSMIDWCKYLVSSGADIESWCTGYLTPRDRFLHGALRRKLYPTARIFLKLGASLKSVNMDGESPLDILIGQGEELEPDFLQAVNAGEVDRVLELWNLRRKDIELLQGFDAHISHSVSLQNPICHELASWVLKPPIGTERAARLESVLNRLKTTGLACCQVELPSSIYVHIKSFNQSVSLSTFSVLQLLALIAEPQLLAAAIAIDPEEASLQVLIPHVEKPSPLQLAAKQGNLECVKILIGLGATPTEAVSRAKPNVGYTALHYAVEGGHMDVAKYLIEHGAIINSILGPKAKNGYRKLENIRRDARGVVETAVRLGRLDFVALFMFVDIRCRSVVSDAGKEFVRTNVGSYAQRLWEVQQKRGGIYADSIRST